jgi:hypothetical protein
VEGKPYGQKNTQRIQRIIPSDKRGNTVEVIDEKIEVLEHCQNQAGANDASN